MGKWIDGYVVLVSGDWGIIYCECVEIFDIVCDVGIIGFVIFFGDWYSFWVGLVVKVLLFVEFKLVGVIFVVGFIFVLGMVEVNEYNFKLDDLLCLLFVVNLGGGVL